MTSFRIEQMFLYPVKSLGGMAVQAAQITPSGSLRGDREWLVTRPDGSMLWQGDIPRMALLSAQHEMDRLVLRDAEGRPGPLPENASDSPVMVEQEGYQLPGFDQGDAVANWLGACLGAACRLVRLGEQAHRWGGLNPVHAVSTVSLAALNTRLAERGELAIAVERFRPNIVLSGNHAAFAEEAARAMDFGPAALDLREPCVRCELPNISLEDASRQKQPLKLIGAMSRERSTARPASFGTYCTARGAVLRVGMST